MLSDAERRSLDEIEQRLCLDEPDLVRAFTPPKRTPWLHYAIMLVFGALGVLLVAIGSGGVGLLCLMVTATTAVLLRHPVGIR
jgi:hypothetical protein